MIYLDFENQEDQPIDVMIEPSTKLYKIPGKCIFQLEIPNIDGLSEFRVDYFSDNFLSIWGPDEARILVSGEEPPYSYA